MRPSTAILKSGLVKIASPSSKRTSFRTPESPAEPNGTADGPVATWNDGSQAPSRRRAT